MLGPAPSRALSSARARSPGGGRRAIGAGANAPLMIVWMVAAADNPADLLFTLQVRRDGDISALTLPPSFEEATALGPRTLTVARKEPFIDADSSLGTMARGPLPKHLLEEAYRSDSELPGPPLLGLRVRWRGPLPAPRGGSRGTAHSRNPFRLAENRHDPDRNAAEGPLGHQWGLDGRV